MVSTITTYINSLLVSIPEGSGSNTIILPKDEVTIEYYLNAGASQKRVKAYSQNLTFLDIQMAPTLSEAGASVDGDTDFDGIVSKLQAWKNAVYMPNTYGSVSLGNKGDITVTGTGDTWNVNAGAIGPSELGGGITTYGKNLIQVADEASLKSLINLESTTDLPEGTNLYFTNARVNALITGKQDTLVSGTNIKTVNGNTLLGSGNIVITGVGGANLSYTASPTNGLVVSDSGTDATLPLADGTNAGLMAPAQHTKLAGIAAGAEVNVNADWNAVSGDAQILNKPSTFAPSAHTHPQSEVTNLVSDLALKAPLASPTFTGTVGGITKAMVGLSNVPNLDTSNPTNITQSASYRFVTDSEKSTWNAKQAAITTGTTGQYIRGDLSLATFPTIPSVGTWGALNYPTWASGTPFLKMTAAGTFALDTSTYLTEVSLLENRIAFGNSFDVLGGDDYFTFSDGGIYVGNSSDTEAGLYHADASQKLATYNPNTGNYYYSNGNYLYNGASHYFTGSTFVEDSSFSVRASTVSIVTLYNDGGNGAIDLYDSVTENASSIVTTAKGIAVSTRFNITGYPPYTSENGSLNIGAGFYGGVTDFNGSVDGTFIAINGNDTAQDFINFQIDGNQFFKVSGSGTVTAEYFSGDGWSISNIDPDNIILDSTHRFITDTERTNWDAKVTNATHTGDVTGATALTIANDAVTFAKMQNIATAKLLGRGSASTGNIEEITLGTNLSFSGTTLNASGGSGMTVHYGAGAPSGGLGADGDLYIDTDGFALYDKASGSWSWQAEAKYSSGTTGQVLSKASNADYDFVWATPGAAANGIPTGGTTNQVLSKIDEIDFNAQWVDPTPGMSESLAIAYAIAL